MCADDLTKRQLIGELLPVLDNLDRAIAISDERGDAPAAVEGMRMIRSQLDTVLRGYGVEKLDALAQPFDPKVHDAIGLLDVTDRGWDGRVIDQLEPCYVYRDQLLRPAKVVVARCAA